MFLLSSGSLPVAAGRNFFDYEGIEEGARILNIKDLELVMLPEWDVERSPLTPSNADWSETPKIGPAELALHLKTTPIRVHSLHVNRDLGVMLSSQNPTLQKRASQVLQENLEAARNLYARLLVIHLWHTYDRNVQLEKLTYPVLKTAALYPEIKISIENIPLSDPDLTSFQAWQILNQLLPPQHGFTLDLNWASLHQSFPQLLEFLPRIMNVHVHCQLICTPQGYQLSPLPGNLDISSALRKITSTGYNGYVTLELKGARGTDDFQRAIALIKKDVPGL